MTNRPDFRRIAMECMARPENKRCVDCGAPNPTWSSCKLGTFLCLTCAGRHRGYGVAISFVRAADLDRWSEEQAGYVLAGGNARFTTFLRQRGLEVPPEYQTPAMQDVLEEYREALRRDSRAPEIRAVIERFKRENGIEDAPAPPEQKESVEPAAVAPAPVQMYTTAPEKTAWQEPESESDAEPAKQPVLNARSLCRKNTKKFGRVIKHE